MVADHERADLEAALREAWRTQALPAAGMTVRLTLESLRHVLRKEHGLTADEARRAILAGARGLS